MSDDHRDQPPSQGWQPPHPPDRRPTDEELALDPGTSPALLASLAEDRPGVRPLVAANSSAPVHTLLWLRELGDPTILAALGRNPTAIAANVVRPADRRGPVTEPVTIVGGQGGASSPDGPGGPSTGGAATRGGAPPGGGGGEAGAGIAAAASRGGANDPFRRGWGTWAIFLVPLLVLAMIAALGQLVRGGSRVTSGGATTTGLTVVTAAGGASGGNSPTLPTQASLPAGATSSSDAGATAAPTIAATAATAAPTAPAPAATTAAPATPTPAPVTNPPTNATRAPATTPSTTRATTPRAASTTASTAARVIASTTVANARVASTTTVVSTTTTVATATATSVYALAQRLATALADSDWTTARAIAPADSRSDAALAADYGNLTDSTVVPVRVVAKGNNVYAMRIGLVAHETTAAGALTTKLFCVVWNADLTAKTISRVTGTLLRSATGRVGVDTVRDEVRTSCAAANLG